MQIALPRHLIEDTEQDHHFNQSQFYLEGLYDGNPAYILTYYFGDYQRVCQPELNLCKQNEDSVLQTKSSWIRLHRLKKNALVSLIIILISEWSGLRNFMLR